jgi:hypothetical protein
LVEQFGRRLTRDNCRHFSPVPEIRNRQQGPMGSYDLSYETRECRCSWCWETIDERTSHTVIKSAGRPFLELRFHHRCWLMYRGLNGIEGRELNALYREWNPQRVETLRMHAGLNMDQMAKKLGIQKGKLIDYFGGHVKLADLQRMYREFKPRKGRG